MLGRRPCITNADRREQGGFATGLGLGQKLRAEPRARQQARPGCPRRVRRVRVTSPAQAGCGPSALADIKSAKALLRAGAQGWLLAELDATVSRCSFRMISTPCSRRGVNPPLQT